MIDLGSTWQGGTTATPRYNLLCWVHLAIGRARRATCFLCQGPASEAAQPGEIAIQHSHIPTAMCFGTQAVSSPLCNAGYSWPEQRYKGERSSRQALQAVPWGPKFCAHAYIQQHQITCISFPLSCTLFSLLVHEPLLLSACLSSNRRHQE